MQMPVGTVISALIVTCLRWTVAPSMRVERVLSYPLWVESTGVWSATERGTCCAGFRMSGSHVYLLCILILLFFFPTENRSVRSVVEADMADPRCAEYRARLMERFKQMFEFPDNILEVDPSLRGNPEDAVASIQLKTGAVPKRVAPYRTVGAKDEAFHELIAKLFKRGMLERSHSAWAARAFCMAKPGGKWRLVIDYRYLKSQINGEQYPLPVIDDIFLKQAKNAIWSIFDLEDGFHQMHLDLSPRPYTAFVTPWGLYQWTILPMGLKTALQA